MHHSHGRHRSGFVRSPALTQFMIIVCYVLRHYGVTQGDGRDHPEASCQGSSFGVGRDLDKESAHDVDGSGMESVV